jgi:hypothetical protein
MTPEGKVKAAIKRVLTSIGAYHHWPVQNGMGAPCLDCHGCWRAIYFAIEAKAPGKVPTPRQDSTIRNIAAAEGLVMVISSVEGANNIPRWLEEHANVIRRDNNS